jgi:hypothetical protein
MRLRKIVQTCAIGSALALGVSAGPAFAHGGEHRHTASEPGAPPAGPDTRPEWRQGQGYTLQGPAREDWLRECRSRISRRDDGLGGAVIGGVIGGVAGNRIAGRGNRTVGTIAGAAVGAVAGAAIDKAEDRGRAKDECEAYLDNYYASYSGGQGYGHHGYAHQGQGYYPAYAPANGCCQSGPMVMVPVMMMPRAEPECTETVETVYEDVPVRRRVYRPRRAPDKRIRVAPDKRVAS